LWVTRYQPAAIQTQVAAVARDAAG
jgi:hypothetical protein